MNSLLLLPALFASDGGIERILRLYVRAAGELTPEGERLAVILLNDAWVSAEQLAPYTTPALQSVIACRRRKVECVWHTLRLARRSNRILCGHVHLLRLAQFARTVTSCREVWLVAHGVEVWKAPGKATTRSLRAADRILCVSDYTRRQMIDHDSGLSPERLVVHPNALDPLFNPAPTPPDRSEPGLILAVARLSAAERYKGVDHLITALPAIRETIPGAHLRIVGDGDDRPRLEDLAARGPAASAIEFTGRISDEVLRQHFDACQLFALPSRGEGFGIVYLEALAHGKPCIAADTGGAPEVVDTASGLRVPYGDVPVLAGACIDALRKPWDPAILRARASTFNYEAFRRRLAAIW